MTCICEQTWRALCALKEAITSPCTSTGDDQPFAHSSNNSNISTTSSNFPLDERVIEADLGLSNTGFEGDSFTTALEKPRDSWRPVLRFHDPTATNNVTTTVDPHTDSGHWTNQSGFTEIDLGDGPQGDVVDGSIPIPNNIRHTDSRSTTRESGYGRSLHDSNGSSSPEPSVAVAFHAPTNPGVYKVVVQDEMRCWFVLRRYHEFSTLDHIIRNKVSDLSLCLPPEEAADKHSLNSFIQAVMINPTLVSIVEVRDFLQLDRFRSSSSTTSGSSSSTPSTPTSLDPRFLMPPGAPHTNRKPVLVKGHSENQVNGHASTKSSTYQTQQSIDLGCTKKSLSPSDFEFLSVIGKGSFGKVLLARYHEDGKVYAVKILNKKLIVRRNETAHVLSERSVLIKMMNHPYLVQLHFAFTTSHKIFFVLDYVSGGELFFHLQRERVFAEPRARFYAAEICLAMAYMHSKGIVYRDLKPENILLDTEGHVVLTDFGLCKEGLQSSSSKTGTFCGTPEYLAPEILKKQPYSRAVDWWTLGAVLYEMLYGLPPFYSRDTPAMYDAILNKPLKLKHTVSLRARSILQGLLQKEPLERLGSGVKDGDEVKEHEFFKTIDWELVARRGITPPFRPIVNGETDTRNVDPMFTRETVGGHSPASPSQLSASVQAVDHFFHGFSYAPPLEIEAK